MALSLRHPVRPDFFERHIRHLAWYMLLASIVLLIPIARRPDSPGFDELTSGLGALVMVVAVLAVIRDVGRYVRQAQVRQHMAVDAARQTGACLAAAKIHDRIANLLSITVGYVELVEEMEPLSALGRDQTGRAIQAALAATRAVSEFKESLGCAGVPIEALPLGPTGGFEPLVQPEQVTLSPGQAWVYEPQSRTIRTPDGVVLATLSPALDRSSATTTGRLITDAPVLWEVLGDTQHLGVSLLASRTWSRAKEAEVRAVVERINALVSHIQP